MFRSTKVAVTMVHGYLNEVLGSIPRRGETRPVQRNRSKLSVGKVRTLRRVRPTRRIRSERVAVGRLMRAISHDLMKILVGYN